MSDKQIRKVLQMRLKQIKTNKNEECSGFLVGGSKDNCRMSLGDVIKASETKEVDSKDILDCNKLVDFLIGKAREEALYKKSNREEKISFGQIVLEVVMNKVESIKKQLEVFQEKVQESVAQVINGQSICTSLLEKIDEPSFGEILDKTLSSLKKDEKQDNEEWKRELQAMVFENATKLLSKILEEKKELFSIITDLFGTGFENQNCKTLNCIPFKNESYCFSGIVKKPGKNHEFAYLTANGKYGLFDSSKDQASQTMKLNGRRSGFSSFMELNPTGTKAIQGLCENGAIVVYDSKDLRECIDSWGFKGDDYFSKAKWINDTTILATRTDSAGTFYTWKIQESSYNTIGSHEDLKGDIVSDFDFLPSKDQIVCCSSGPKFHVSRVSIEGSQAKLIWKHQKHTCAVRVVRASKTANYVVSGGEDCSVVLADAENGAILTVYSQSSYGHVQEIIWSPKGDQIVVMSHQQVAMLSVNRKSEKPLKLIDRYGTNRENFVCMAAYWTEESVAKKTSYLITGSSLGTTCKTPLRDNVQGRE